MSWILAFTTFGVLASIGVACWRAQADATDKLCDCMEHTHAAPAAVSGGGRPHLRLVDAS